MTTRQGFIPVGAGESRSRPTRGGATLAGPPPAPMAALAPWPNSDGNAQELLWAVTSSADRLMTFHPSFPAGAPNFDAANPLALPVIQSMCSCVGRGQSGEGQPASWQAQQTAAFRPQGGGMCFFSYCWFPAVLRRGANVQTIPYMVYTSSHRINPKLLRDLFQIDSDSSQFAVVRTVPNKFSNDDETVRVWNRFIGDENAQLSIVAALTNTAPVNGSYVYIFPWVRPEVFAAMIEDMGPYAFNVSGASMGAAVGYAQLCGAPVLVTGQLANFGDGRIPRTEEQRAAVGASSDINRQFGLYDTRNFDIVESVDLLGYKIALPLEWGVPLILPFKSQLGGNIQEYLKDRKVVDPGLKFILSRAGDIRNSADILDAINFRRNYSVLYMATNLMDACIGGANMYFAAFGSAIQMNPRTSMTEVYRTEAETDIDARNNERYRELLAKRKVQEVRSRANARLKKENAPAYLAKKKQDALARLKEGQTKRLTKQNEKLAKSRAKIAAMNLDKKPPNPYKRTLASQTIREGLREKAKRQSALSKAERVELGNRLAARMRQQPQQPQADAAPPRMYDQVAGGGAGADGAAVQNMADLAPAARLGSQRSLASSGRRTPANNLIDDIDFGDLQQSAGESEADNDDVQRMPLPRAPMSDDLIMPPTAALPAGRGGRGRTDARAVQAVGFAPAGEASVTRGRGAGYGRGGGRGFTGRGARASGEFGTSAAGTFGQRRINFKSPVMAAGVLGDALDLLF